MMNSAQNMEEKSVLRWGGLAGVLGSLVLIVSGIVSAVVGPEPTQLEELIRFPEVRGARTVENSLYLLALLLMASHFLALHHALRKSRPAPALFGSGLGVIGLAVMAAGALLHVASVPLSDLYHAPGTTAEAQATLALIWQATWGVFEALLGAGLFAVTIGVVGLGTAMLRAPTMGRGVAWLSIVLGVIGIAAALVFIIDPPSPIAALGVLALIVFHLAVGWKVYRLSRAA
jgi:uncharacterized membrane protein HdeD (DUF308 family)